MKGFNRPNQLFALCGLNCGLCPMFLNKYCPGCGGGEGNQSCKIARCSMEHGGVEYCFQCSEYPCPKYDHIDDFDSFITHRNRKSDMEKAKRFGIDTYSGSNLIRTRVDKCLLLHCNWGWSGDHNGYFASGAFDAVNGRVLGDDGVVLPLTRGENTRNYTWWFRIVTYNKP